MYANEIEISRKYVFKGKEHLIKRFSFIPESETERVRICSQRVTEAM